MRSAPSSRRQNRRARALLVVAVVAALVGGVIGGLIVHATESTPKAAPPTPVSNTTNSGETVCNAVNVAKKALPSVVTIRSTSSDGSGSTGSGEVIDSSGHVLTNNHVISGAARSGGSVHAVFSDGASSPATIVGRDPLTDLAVLKVSDDKDLTPIPLGTSSTLLVGQPVVALGAPLGLSSTVTGGIVSALGRTIQVNGEDNRNALLINAIQTDAAINPGNSGGALVNCSGQLVGIPSAGASVPNASGGSSSGSVGLGFAIPVDAAKTVSAEIISTGRVQHASFGMSAAPVNSSAAASANLPEGLYVSHVESNGPAHAAGIQVGDVITQIAGERATTTDQLSQITLSQKPGSTVQLTVARAGSTRSLTVTLGTEP